MVEIKHIVNFLAAHRTTQNIDCSDTYTAKEQVLKDFKKHGQIGLMDEAQVCMVVLKNENLVFLALGMFQADVFTTKIPDLNYQADKFDVGKVFVSKYGDEYLKIVVELLKSGECPKIYLKQDYPLKVELEKAGITIILSPRVEN